MQLLPFQGYMIPGLYLESDNCIWILRWKETPTPIKQMTEIWVITSENKKVCYVDPGEGIPIFNKYHSFDEVIGSQISIEETKGAIRIRGKINDLELLTIDIKLTLTLENRIVNLLLKTRSREKFVTRGKTETGKAFSNEPVKIVAISEATVTLHGKDCGKLIKPRKKISIGDGVNMEKPIINYCIHRLEG